MKLARIKTDFAGRAIFLGEEVFVWRKNAKSIHATDYPNSMFQLISGVNGSQLPGYHCMPGWVTVCPTERVKPAYFLGVKRTELRKLSKRERAEKGIKDEAKHRHENSGRPGPSGKGRAVKRTAGAGKVRAE